MANTSTWENYPQLQETFQKVKNPTILAFSCYFHDSSACILKDGKIIAAADEERFTRKKHDASFPKNAIEYCLDFAQVDTIDAVVFYENPDVKWDRIQNTLKQNPPSQTTYDKINEIWSEVKSRNNIQNTFTNEIGLPNTIIFLDHHLCHAASSYYMSGFDEAAIVTIDGVGEKVTTSFGKGKGNNIALEKCVNFPHSIGLLYTAITVFLGFKANDHEYKVMGLAPYGIMDKEKNPYYAKLKKVIELYQDGSFKLRMEYFGHENFESPAYTESMAKLLDLRPNQKDGPITKDHENLAAALQMLTEDAVLNLLNAVYKATDCTNLCFSGGVALNSVLNGKILSRTPFRNIFIQPSAGDSGTVIGAAKYAQSKMDPESKVTEHTKHSSYGPDYTTEEIEKFLNNKNIKYKKYNNHDELLEATAKLLSEKLVIGWFQERMEWGPRALGNRSILASPCYPEMRDILNEKVKHRELFRPFAPVVCVDDAPNYFECDLPIPQPTDYMLMVYPIKKEQRSKIPAVTHVDGSGRLQTIREEQNPLYYKLIKKFGVLTGIPILINTSFNIRGEPIVCSPADAYRCMMGTAIDYLVIDRFLIKRSDNLKDAWSPEIDD